YPNVACDRVEQRPVIVPFPRVTSMVFQLPIFLVFAALSSWFFPNANRVVLTESLNGQTVRTIHIEKDPAKGIHSVKLVPIGQTSDQATRLAEFKRAESQVTWTIGQGSSAIQKVMNLGDKIAQFSSLSPDSSATINVEGLGTFKVSREKHGIHLTHSSGQSYRFKVQTGADSPQGKTEVKVQTSGQKKGWRVYPKSLTLNDYDPKMAASEPGMSVLALVNDLKTQPSKGRLRLSKTMPTERRAAFEAHAESLGQRIQSVNVSAYLKHDDVEAQTPRMVKLIKPLMETFGPADTVVFAEFNDASKDAFILLDYVNGTYTVKAVISRFASELIPNQKN
ncbi:MAG: hypothetical protein VYA30_14860, partial [Myxococcota bacterium]|nr:hypothetical protein [Myxococcota bacterium]